MTVRNLRAEIARKDLSKGEIAHALGISQSALSDIGRLLVICKWVIHKLCSPIKIGAYTENV